MMTVLSLAQIAGGLLLVFIGAQTAASGASAFSRPRPGSSWAFLASAGPRNNFELQARGEDVSFNGNVIEARDRRGVVVARIEVLDRDLRPLHLVGTQWFGERRDENPWDNQETAVAP